MSAHDLKPGDQVRVTRRYRLADCRPGDKGVVASGPKYTADGKLCYYHVLMDQNGPASTSVLFAEDEIEPDV